MIRGWRNDPRWVEYYAKRDAEMAQRAAERQMLSMQVESDLVFRALRNKDKTQFQEFSND